MTDVNAIITYVIYNHGSRGVDVAQHVVLEPKSELNLFVVIPVTLI